MSRDYSERALSRLPSQFEDKPRFRGLVQAMVSALSELEADADQIRAMRWIDTAQGVQLDGCGSVVGVARKGRDDEAFRQAIRFQVFVNIAQGVPSDLIYAIKFITKPENVQYMEMYPCTAILFTDGLLVDKETRLLIQDIAPVAIRDVPIVVSYLAKPFRFGKTEAVRELFVNASYMTAQSSDVTVSGGTADNRFGEGLGGVVPAELSVGVGYLNVGGPTLAAYNPNSLTPIGQTCLPGVFQ